MKFIAPVIERFNNTLDECVYKIYKLKRQNEHLTSVDVAVKQRDIHSPAPIKTIFICTDERTGSHFLAELMATTGVLGRPYEYFNTSWMKLHYADYTEDFSEQFKFSQRLGTTPNGVFSLKVHPWTMDLICSHGNIVSSLPDKKFIFLYREKLLDQAISLLRAHQTGVYVKTFQTDSVRDPYYDGNALDALLKNLSVRKARWELYFARNNINPLRISYESIVAHPQKIVSQIRTYAAVKERAVAGKYTWYRHERTSDQLNRELAAAYYAEFANFDVLDSISTEALSSSNGVF